MANPYRRPFMGSTHRWQLKLWLRRNPWFSILLLAFLLSALTYLVEDKYFDEELLPLAPEVECNGDVKQCYDGTIVGRVGPDCEFAECPELEPGDELVEPELMELPESETESESEINETSEESKSDEPVQQESEQEEQTEPETEESTEDSESNSTEEE